MCPAARDPYAIEDDDLVMVDKEDVEDQSPKEGSRGSAPSKRRSKREVRLHFQRIDQKWEHSIINTESV